MQLKKYQSRTLKILSDFLNYARLLGNEKAFEKYQDAQGYSTPTFDCFLTDENKIG